jgi:hypothetical protein
MIRQDGTLVTVYVDRQFSVVGVETGMPAPGQAGAAAPAAWPAVRACPGSRPGAGPDECSGWSVVFAR